MTDVERSSHHEWFSLTRANYYQVKQTEKYLTKFTGGTIWKMYSKHNPILPSFFLQITLEIVTSLDALDALINKVNHKLYRDLK